MLSCFEHLMFARFSDLSSFKDRFEKGIVGDEEGHEKTAIDLDIQLKSIKDSLGKVSF
jgi:hypothetical protein